MVLAGAPPANATASSRTALWASALVRSTVHEHPRPTARSVGRLHFLTEDGKPEVYMVRRRVRDHDGRRWVRLSLPGRRPRDGWVPAGTLTRLRVVHSRIDISRRRLELVLRRGGRVLLRAPVGIGAPDSPTPAGRFWIREKLPTPGAPIYGARALGTSAYSPVLTDWPGGGVIGIHGTDRPELIPGRPSHGCIRLRNTDVVRLYRLTPLGTSVRIH